MKIAPLSNKLRAHCFDSFGNLFFPHCGICRCHAGFLGSAVSDDAHAPFTGIA